jgi:hypothetical protein
MDVAGAVVDIRVGNLALVLDADGADCNHSAHRAEEVHTCEEEAEGNMDDADDVNHVADEVLLRASAAALRACAFPCVRQLASDIPYADVSSPLRRRHRLHLLQDSFHCACRLPVRSTPFPPEPKASKPFPQVEPPSHAPMVHHFRSASAAKRAKKRTCCNPSYCVYDSLACQVGGTLPSVPRSAYGHSSPYKNMMNVDCEKNSTQRKGTDHRSPIRPSIRTFPHTFVFVRRTGFSIHFQWRQRDAMEVLWSMGHRLIHFSRPFHSASQALQIVPG